MAELSPLLADRWSPLAFDPVVELTDTEVASLLEAARWAPSADNTQPWRFVVGRRDDETYKRIFTNLSAGNRRWAGRASVLLVGAHTAAPEAGRFAPEAGRFAPEAGRSAPEAETATRAAYDLGQAVAHLTIQATALRLHVHQMTGFDVAGLRTDLELPAGVRPHIVVAIGRLGDPLSLPEDLRRWETRLRSRRPLADLLIR